MKIFKYDFPLKDEIIIQLPKQSRILDIQYQNHKLMLWAIVEPQFELIDYSFKVFGTGMELNYYSNLEYINTVQDLLTGFVWHIFRDLS